MNHQNPLHDDYNQGTFNSHRDSSYVGSFYLSKNHTKQQPQHFHQQQQNYKQQQQQYEQQSGGGNYVYDCSFNAIPELEDYCQDCY